MFAAAMSKNEIGVILLVLFTVICLIVVTVGMYAFSRFRGNRIARFAKQNGWRYIPNLRKGQMFGNDPSIPNSKLRNVIIRKEAGCTILYFEFPAGRSGHVGRVVTISERLRFPSFEIIPKGKPSFSFRTPIQFPPTFGFSSAVKVYSDRPNEVRALLDDNAVAELSKCGRFWLTASGPSFFADAGFNPASTATIKAMMYQQAFIHWSLTLSSVNQNPVVPQRRGTACISFESSLEKAD